MRIKRMQILAQEIAAPCANIYVFFQQSPGY